MKIKDSGKRVQMPGMVRDTTEGKIRYDLTLDGPMFRRWSEHLTAGAVKYAARNWMGAKSQEELDRFKESAIRHFIQWINGEIDEDHAAAVFFNINGAEMVKAKLAKGAPVKMAFWEPGSATVIGERRSATVIGDRRSDVVDRRQCTSLTNDIWRRQHEIGRRLGDSVSYLIFPRCQE